MTQVLNWNHDMKNKVFHLAFGNSQNTNSSALIRFICVGIVASVASLRIALGVQVPLGCLQTKSEATRAKRC